MGEWTFETAVNCTVCPDCAFTFDEDHEDTDGGYSCPVCAEARLIATFKAIRDIAARPINEHETVTVRLSMIELLAAARIGGGES